MKIYKFGGASIKDADSVINVVKVLQKVGYNDCLIVASAMGKTTNALELVLESYHNNKNWQDTLNTNKQYHFSILNDLFTNRSHAVFNSIQQFYNQISSLLNTNTNTNKHYIYDQIVSFGELISTTIISSYLNEVSIKNIWLDARKLIKTNHIYRDAEVDWEETETLIKNKVQTQNLYITQGFIGGNQEGKSTTLGREGSDYSAAIFAYVLNAENVTIWKDVPGVLNADPNVFEKTELLHQISYQEAIEMAFYGASVIHPKTLQPLQNKEIPLFVKSFKNPMLNGTKVTKGIDIKPLVPCFIVKKNQLLISFSSKNFSFIMEEQVSEIFSLLAKYHIKVSVIQNSAISFSVCVEDKFNHLYQLLDQLSTQFKITCNENVTLHTIRHFTEKDTEEIKNKHQVLLQQTSRETIQLITK